VSDETLTLFISCCERIKKIISYFLKKYQRHRDAHLHSALYTDHSIVEGGLWQ
jgi:hypothetical protein